jgi:hypothetical protein
MPTRDAVFWTVELIKIYNPETITNREGEEIPGPVEHNQFWIVFKEPVLAVHLPGFSDDVKPGDKIKVIFEKE